MRRIKLFALTALAALTVTLAVGCSGGTDESKTPETKKTEQESELGEYVNNNDEGSGEDSTDLSSMFQNLNTVDIKGEKVTKDIFADNKLTLVNIWATWCGPCVKEIPELEELSKEYDGKGVAIKGLLAQVDMNTGELVEGLTDDERKTAEDILKSSNVTYQQILVSKDMKKSLGDVQGFPTTYFINKDGKIVGEPYVGASEKEVWKQVIDERLDMLEAK